MRYDVAILGAGPAGIAAAFSLARGGKKVAVVENRQAGGTCLNRGCIPTKMLLGGIAPLELVLALKKQKVLSGEVGVDFKALRTRMDRFVKGSSQMVEKNLVASGVDFIKGAASLESPGVVAVSCEDGAKSLEAEDIILACGSRNAAFPGMEPDGDCVLNSTSLLAIETIPSSLLVIGAGAIGLEMGHFFAAMGSKVTIVEGAAHIAPLEDADIADELRKTLKKRGIACVEGVFAKSLVTKDGQAELTMADGTVFTASKALVAVGRKPNTENLGCEKAGISLDRRGYVEVDDHLRAAPHIYAVGDVNGQVLLAHAAEHQARYVSGLILGTMDAPYSSGPVPSCYYGLEIMRVGSTAAQLLAQGRDKVSVSKAPLTLNAIAQSHSLAQGFVKAVWDGEELAGMAAIGHDVSHLVTQAQMLVREKRNAHNVHEIMFAHPTLDEILVNALVAERVKVQA